MRAKGEYAVATCGNCGRHVEGAFPFCPYCRAELTPAPSPREQRKRVTVLFCDITGSTALGESTDPEALRALLARYFERMQGIIERHGRTVDKFIGDAGRSREARVVLEQALVLYERKRNLPMVEQVRQRMAAEEGHVRPV